MAQFAVPIRISEFGFSTWIHQSEVNSRTRVGTAPKNGPSSSDCDARCAAQGDGDRDTHACEHLLPMRTRVPTRILPVIQELGRDSFDIIAVPRRPQSLDPGSLDSGTRAQSRPNHPTSYYDGPGESSLGSESNATSK